MLKIATPAELQAAGADLRAVAKSVATRKKGAALLVADYNKLVKANATIAESSTVLLEGHDLATVTASGARLFGVPPPNAPAVEDLQAPPPPTGNAGISAAGSATFTCEQTGDMHDAVTTPAGLPTGSGAYILNIDGVDQAAINAPNANIQTLPVLKNIGAISPSPTALQTGTQWTLTSKGTGVDDTTDSLAMLGWEVTGDFDLYMNLSAFAGIGADSYAPCGLMARVASAASVEADVGAIYFSMHGWLTGNNAGVEFKDRRVVSTIYAQRFTANGTAHQRWLHRRKRRSAGTDIFTGRYSFDGGPWQTAYVTPALAGLSNTMFVGKWLSDNQASPSLVTATSNGLILLTGTQNVVTSAAYTTSGVVTGKWRVRDANGNLSAYGPTTTASGAPVGGQIQWHCGHYLGPQDIAFLGDAGSRASRQSVYNIVAGSSLWKGAKVIIPWGAIETALGVYDFSELDSDIAYLQARNRKLIIEVWWMKFSTTTLAHDTRYIPQYLYDGGYVVLNTSSHTTTVEMNNSYAAGRFIALSAALAARYDSNVTVEQFIITETSNSSCGQLLNIVNAVGAHWTRTTTVLYANYFDVVTPAALITAMAAVKMGMGSPDLQNVAQFGGEEFGARALQGVGTSNYQYQVGDGGSLDCGSIDYRGKVPVSYSYEALSGKTVANLIGYAMNTLKCTHMVWTYGEGGAAGTNYSDGILPQVTAISGVSGATACPTTYAGACDTG